MSESGDRFQYTERDLLIRLSEQVKNLTDETRRSSAGIAADVRDHEARLRIIENFRWWVLGAAGCAAFVSGLFGAYIGRLFPVH